MAKVKYRKLNANINIVKHVNKISILNKHRKKLRQDYDKFTEIKTCEISLYSQKVVSNVFSIVAME